MGVVYAARQSSIARTVALKMLKADDADAAQRDKFISEAVVTGELDHPNIVPIYDLGANDEGALFYSMKRVKGTPWHKVHPRQRSLDENLNILLRVADAVAFAHANGVIHRDLKPENVMLGDFGEVLVMDWGLARVTSEFPSAASVTQSDAWAARRPTWRRRWRPGRSSGSRRPATSICWAPSCTKSSPASRRTPARR